LATVEEQASSIKSLSGKGIKGVQILGPDAARPAGCVAYPVSTDASVFLHVKGRVDLDAEIAKAQKKLDKAKGNIQKQEKILKDSNYLEKVSDAVREADEKKLADAKQELNSFEETIKQFEQLKLE
jgi:valyl-tRNA synthetase